ncbi:hypothetical protein [Varibaculum massiliense]|uniref:hypothetical protein n=1 Tax=Varibaculum massiliense TaxID=1852372 RepID=UPI0008D92CC8|nr:hypothetical protein [Varibaculum massiliense]
MSESDFPSRALEQQAYSPISKYGQISIAEQLARLEEIRTGGHRPSYRPEAPSPESQWGQIQEGFSQVESDLSWQLRQIPPDEPRHPQRPLSPDQDGRSWVQEYRDKQRMRKVAQEARAQAEADLQRLLKEREEAQARAQEQERLAAEAAERLRKLEEAEQETLRTAARNQQRREQRVLDAQVEAAKSEAEKMAELLESFQNPQVAPSKPDVTERPAAAEPAVPIAHAPAYEQVAVKPAVAPTAPAVAERVAPQAPTTPTPALPQSLPQVSTSPAPLPAVSRQSSQGVPQVQPVSGQPRTSSRIFADPHGATGLKPTSKPAASSFAQSDAAVGGKLDGDSTQPIKVSPIDSLADAADDRALADQLALASGARPVSPPAFMPAPATAAPRKPAPSTLPARYEAPAAHSSQQRGGTPQYPAGSATTVQRLQQPANVTTQVNAPAGMEIKGESAGGAPVSIAAAGAGSAAELFQQALAQTRLGGANTAIPADTATAIAANLTAPVPALQAAPSPTVAATAARVSSAQLSGASLAPRTGSLAGQSGNQVSPRPAPAPPATSMRQAPEATFPPAAAQSASIVQPASAQIPVVGQATPLTQSTIAVAPTSGQPVPTVQPAVTAKPAAPVQPQHPAPSPLAAPAGSQGLQMNPMAVPAVAPASIIEAPASPAPVGAAPAATAPTGGQLAPAPSAAPEAVAPAVTALTAPASETVPAQVATPAPVTTEAPSGSERSASPATSDSEEPAGEEKTRWWQRKRKAKKAEAPEQEDTRYGASLESPEDQGEEEPLTFIQTFLRWTLRLSILLIIALGMVLTMDRPVISQTMGQDMVQPGIVDGVSVLQI